MTRKPRLRFRISIVLVALGVWAASCYAQEKHFTTRYTDIVYEDEVLLKEFLWHLTGKRYTLAADTGEAKGRVDRIVGRVEDILDMRPKGFNVRVLLYPRYDQGYKASYIHGIRTIKVYTDVITDGIFAHEVAHAVISAYFQTPPPRNTQEILTRYVDQHLWEDYF
ncbi:MAG: hypothetical protein PHS37_09385 [Candidatus Omnitrophica bacterium]|nr:hypothetical protein [Candidatus Omnitrophota bacterium]